jgi:hypothetical protein
LPSVIGGPLYRLNVCASHGLHAALRRPGRWWRFGAWCWRFELGEDRFQRVEARRIRVAGVIDRLQQVLCECGDLVVGEI